MNCDEFREYISERLAGEISSERTEQFDDHQRACSGCRKAVRDWQQLENLLRTSWPSQDPPYPFFLPAAKVHPSWLGTVRNWVSVASMAVVAASLLFLVVSRPSIQYRQHALSINFGQGNSPSGTAPAQPVSQVEVQAWVQAAVEQSMAAKAARLQPASHPSSDLSAEEQSRQLARLSVELEMVKETQASLWRQMQQQGLYLQSAWSRPSEQIRPNQESGTSRQ